MPRTYRKGKESPNYRPALERFAEKCRFDPTTGCVLWTGGTSAGRGNSARYGRFWDHENNRMVYAHRWAAVNIHGIDLGEHQGGHCCPHGPNTLCVQHLQAQTQTENLAEQSARLAKAKQAPSERQFWLFVELGIERLPELEVDADLPPFYDPPEWLRPFLKREENDNDCPF